MERHCTEQKCDKCGSTMNVLSAKTVGKPEPTIEEKIDVFKKRAEAENKQFTVQLKYEGEATWVYLFGPEQHEHCGGHFQKKYDVNLDELEINRNKP